MDKQNELKIFRYEKKFLEDKNFLSITTLSGKLNLSPKDLETKNIERIFSNSVYYEDGELYLDYICKLKSGIFLYLSKESPVNVYYDVKIYYNTNQKNEVSLLIKNLIKMKDGNIESWRNSKQNS